MLRRRLGLLIIAVVVGCGSPSSGTESVAGKDADTRSPFMYRCESGNRVTVCYSAMGAATVKYKNDTYEMNLAVSASGARYVGGGLEWWTKGISPGSESTVFRHTENGTTGKTLEQCKQISGKP